MNRKLKALSLAITAITALAAFSPSIASADFDIEPSSHIIFPAREPADGTSVAMTFNAGTVTCGSGSFTGTSTGTTVSEVTGTPFYSECTAFGFVSAQIDVNGCTRTYTTATTPTPATAVRLHINCKAGSSIKITAFNCHVSIGPQTLTGVTYTNQGAGSTRDIYVHTNSSSIKYTQESKSFPGCTNGTFTNGTYKSAITLIAVDTFDKHVGIWTTHAL